MGKSAFGTSGISGWPGGGGYAHSEFCFGHIPRDHDDDGLGFGGVGETKLVDFDEGDGAGCGGNSSSPRKPLDEYTTKELGAQGERIAASFLADHGYRILDMNWRCPAGEIDIVATMDDPDEGLRRSAILVEVKTRLALGDEADYVPELAVDPQKKLRYRMLGLYYLVQHTELDSVRFDVVAINIVGEGQAKLRHLLGAFTWDD
ncbi:YraN family protein [Olsenella sp. Marseille-P4559]|uniref:YraN family protein n=1 Tax=Olsenella sp. Marseille-P4559 TaxID=2364795 RepID=UPI001031EA8D|nr:YraN family protein [Olsenella sp. Marseille-P4559]